MPQQLIYTSAPRGLVAGRSGYCTVARSVAMREALVLRLEQLSYYQHLSLGGVAEHPIFAHRVIDIRSVRFHVLTRIQDAGLDFTGRTNFIAHHLALTPEECGQFATPPLILRDWKGWARNWSVEPRFLENEDWSDISALAAQSSLPAQNWRQLTGDAVNAYGLLELPAGVAIRINSQSDETVLALFAESLELLEVRDPRRDWRANAWQHTFTTCLQEQDNPADFRWRCIQADGSARAEGRALTTITAGAWTDEEAALARGGKQPPRFVVEPQNTQIGEGETARLEAIASGVPNVTYQWFKLDRDQKAEPIEGATSSELILKNPPRGISRYSVTARNCLGEAVSRPAVLSVELRAITVNAPANSGSGTTKDYQKSAEQIEQQRLRMEEEDKEKRRNKKMFFRLFLGLALPFVIAAAAAIALAIQRLRQDSANNSPSPNPAQTTVAPNPAPNVQSAPPPFPRPPAAAHTSNVPAAPVVSSQIVKSNSISNRDVTMSAAETFDLPPGFVFMPIGATKQAHFQFFPDAKPQAVTLSGAAEGFNDNSDDLIFACRANSKKDFSARLETMESPTPGSRCGIMVRQTARTNSPFIFVGVSSEGLMVHMRDLFGHTYSQTRPASAPLWLKISEVENGRFAPSWSSGGVVSSLDPEYSVQLKKPSLIGFAIASGNTANIIKARFTVTN